MEAEGEAGEAVAEIITLLMTGLEEEAVQWHGPVFLLLHYPQP